MLKEMNFWHVKIAGLWSSLILQSYILDIFNAATDTHSMYV